MTRPRSRGVRAPASFVRRAVLAGGCVLISGGCGTPSAPSGGGDDQPPIEISCSIPETEIFLGSARDAIPALIDPELVAPGAPGTDFWMEDDRVIGIVVEGQPIAVPLNILWWHEAVNLDVGDTALTVTHSPLSGSSLVFDRAVVGGATFGISGLVYRNNLLLYNRTDDVLSLWPQMLREARCGPLDGTPLPTIPAVEMSYEGWTRLHPDTRVVSDRTGFPRDYWSNPYLDYGRENNDELLFPLSTPLDRRRPAKERVLGIPDGEGGLAWPFGALEDRGTRLALEAEVGGEPLVVFWDAEVRAAMAYRPRGPAGEPLTFRVDGGAIVDDETGSEWSVIGEAYRGPLEGTVLEPVAEAFVAYWFAWPAFHPEIELRDGAS